MKDIEDMLDCAVCIPDVDDLSWAQFDHLAQKHKDAVCRSLFHAINWLIEGSAKVSSPDELDLELDVPWEDRMF